VNRGHGREAAGPTARALGALPLVGQEILPTRDNNCGTQYKIIIIKFQIRIMAKTPAIESARVLVASC
jgi:hypothetical protein